MLVPVVDTVAGAGGGGTVDCVGTFIVGFVVAVVAVVAAGVVVVVDGLRRSIKVCRF
jgi:hypothetical protein